MKRPRAFQLFTVALLGSVDSGLCLPAARGQWRDDEIADHRAEPDRPVVDESTEPGSGDLVGYNDRIASHFATHCRAVPQVHSFGVGFDPKCSRALRAAGTGPGWNHWGMYNLSRFIGATVGHPPPDWPEGQKSTGISWTPAATGGRWTQQDSPRTLIEVDFGTGKSISKVAVHTSSPKRSMGSPWLRRIARRWRFPSRLPSKRSHPTRTLPSGGITASQPRSPSPAVLFR